MRTSAERAPKRARQTSALVYPPANRAQVASLQQRRDERLKEIQGCVAEHNWTGCRRWFLFPELLVEMGFDDVNAVLDDLLWHTLAGRGLKPRTSKR